MGCCGKTLHTLILVTASSLYLLLGLILVVGSASTFFTDYGKIITPMYAASSLGGGLVILGVSVIGFKAACSRKKNLLGTFMVLDIVLLIVAIVSSALMFEYEHVLDIAAESNLNDDVAHGIATLSKVRTDVIKKIANNAWTACDGQTVYNSGTFTFSCNATQVGTTPAICVVRPAASPATMCFSSYRPPSLPPCCATRPTGHMLLVSAATPCHHALLSRLAAMCRPTCHHVPPHLPPRPAAMWSRPSTSPHPDGVLSSPSWARTSTAASLPA